MEIQKKESNKLYLFDKPIHRLTPWISVLCCFHCFCTAYITCTPIHIHLVLLQLFLHCVHNLHTNTHPPRAASTVSALRTQPAHLYTSTSCCFHCFCTAYITCTLIHIHPSACMTRITDKLRLGAKLNVSPTRNDNIEFLYRNIIIQLLCSSKKIEHRTLQALCLVWHSTRSLLHYIIQA